MVVDRPNEKIISGRPQNSDDAVFPKYCGN